MSIILENETLNELSQEEVQLMEQLTRETLNYLECPYEAEVSITIVDNHQMKELNLEHRDIDEETDVLSFPLINFLQPAKFEDNIDFFNPDTGELMLGDIVLSYEKAMEQAKEYGHSNLREIGFLVVHSMLHLMGYDHMEQDQEQTMNDLQEKILAGIGLVR